MSMNSQPEPDELIRRSEPGERQRRLAERFSGVGNHVRVDVHGPKQNAGYAGIRRRRRSQRLAAGLLGAAAFSALIYGAATHDWAAGPVSITSKLPDARSVGAAVQSLPPPDLLKPVSPEEAVKSNEERPFVARPDTPASRFVLKASADDRERALTCLTQAVYYEAASEGVDGERAVAQVVLNRLRHPGYPSSVCGVVYQGSDRPTGCQFTFTCDGSLLRPHVQSLWTRSQKVAKEALSGRVFAPVGHATHYHADYVLPYWADSLDKTVQIGRHIFYRLRGAVGDSRSFFQRYAGFEPPLPAPRPAIASAPPPSLTPDEQQLAKIVIGEDSKGTAQDAEKAALPTSPLLADAVRPTLVADEHTPIHNTAKPKQPTDCAADRESKQLTPLSADDFRSTASRGC